MKLVQIVYLTILAASSSRCQCHWGKQSHDPSEYNLQRPLRFLFDKHGLQAMGRDIALPCGRRMLGVLSPKLVEPLGHFCSQYKQYVCCVPFSKNIQHR
ncbi:uncharacterized protein F5147DRAFT_418899 [Suillus discolor]|uniref:Secreted protein n=1 Tax=Suillus discolor TaxID=1912936 RepID=A0A9P7EXR8_9AGAM|nr:uncharacterized protein F5147DRAFT_418899 [Suillus discolor]KAG2094053.1 hypothetical protein F5147DRAFT_418899 [Suillus discolor]